VVCATPTCRSSSSSSSPGDGGSSRSSFMATIGKGVRIVVGEVMIDPYSIGRARLVGIRLVSTWAGSTGIRTTTVRVRGGGTTTCHEFDTCKDGYPI